MTRGMWASLAGIVVVLVLGATYLTTAIAQIHPFARHTTVTMALDRSGGLAPGSPVLLRGIEIGRVAGIDYVAPSVEVRLELDGEPRIPVDSTVRIENLSALGEPYVEFSPTSERAPFLRDGQRIDTRQVSEPIPLSQVARSAAHLMNELDPTVLASLTATFDRSFAGLASVTPELSRSTELLAATLMTRLPTIRTLLQDLQDMGADMAWFESATVQSAPLWTLFAQRFSEIVDSLAGISNVGDTPAMYMEGDGLIPVIERVTTWVRQQGPEFTRLAPALRPLTESTPSAPIDLSALISQALGTVGSDGTLHLQIALK